LPEIIAQGSLPKGKGLFQTIGKRYLGRLSALALHGFQTLFMTIEKNYFALFGLPERFQVDSAELSDRYLSLQKTLHPDRAHQSEREQLRAVQAVAQLNAALATLKSPLKRAAYLLELKGVDTDSSAATIGDTDFLLQQMLLREQLDDAKQAADPDAALESLLETLESHEQPLKETLVNHLASSEPLVLQQALVNLRKLQFFDKLRQQIELVEDQLADL
jgi:molecular chaperone HscB